MTPRHDDFVSKIVTDPKNPPNTLLLKGYIGASSEEGHVRLYLDSELSEYVEIPEAAILHSQEIAKEKSPIGGSYIWIQRDAPVIQGPVVADRVQASFLEGRIMSARAVAPVGPLAPTIFGPGCGTIIDGCTDAGPKCPTTTGRTCPDPCTTGGPTCQTRLGTTCPAPTCTQSGPNCPTPACPTQAGNATCPAPTCTQSGPNCVTTTLFSTCSGPNCQTTPEATCCGPNCPTFPVRCQTVQGATCPTPSCTQSGPNCPTPACPTQAGNATCPAPSCTRTGPNCPTNAGDPNCTDVGPRCRTVNEPACFPTETARTCVPPCIRP